MQIPDFGANPYFSSSQTQWDEYNDPDDNMNYGMVDESNARGVIGDPAHKLGV